MKNITIQTDDNEYARYLAQYLFENSDKFIEDDQDNTYIYQYWVNPEKLYKVICEFENTMF